MNTTNNVFTYTEETPSGAITAAIPSTAAAWKAEPKASLNDCAADTGYWEHKIKTAESGNGAANKTHGKGAVCNVLAPGYGKLDETGAAQFD